MNEESCSIKKESARTYKKCIFAGGFRYTFTDEQENEWQPKIYYGLDSCKCASNNRIVGGLYSGIKFAMCCYDPSNCPWYKETSIE